MILLKETYTIILKIKGVKMGLFSSLKKTLEGIEGVTEEEKEQKAYIFLLHFRELMKKVRSYDADEVMELVTAIVITGVFAAKSDGNFSKSEAMELFDFMDSSMDSDEISREEILEIILIMSEAPMKMKDLGTLAINLSRKYGQSSIDALRSFIEYIIYSDGEVHPQELRFLDDWDTTIKIMSSHTRY